MWGSNIFQSISHGSLMMVVSVLVVMVVEVVVMVVVVIMMPNVESGPYS